MAKLSSPGHPVALATGMFPECPAWSNAGRTLAYLIQREDDPRGWDLRTWHAGTTTVVKTFQTEIPSSQGPEVHRTFDWTPEGSDLVFMANLSLYSFVDGQLERLGTEGSLRAVLARSHLPTRKHWRTCRLSPDGTVIGVGIGGAIGMYSNDGTRLRVESINDLRGWAGSEGLLANDHDYFLRSYEAHGGGKRLVEKAFKKVIGTSPSGAWFAYQEPHERPELIFRNPDGSMLRTVHLGFRPGVIQAIEGQRALEPIWFFWMYR
jgi:hypothetical protein